MSTTARAVRFDRYGGRDVLHTRTVALPDPTGAQVLVAVRAAGINPGEAAIRAGALEASAPSTFPSGQGSDLAGVVVATGPDAAAAFRPGDEVLGWSWERSSHASHVLVPADQLISKPAGLEFTVAGALYVVGATAWAAVQAVDPQAGETVVVSAAAGGVGTVVVQLLAERGVRVVGIASDANAAWLQAHGAMPVAYGDGLTDRIRAAAPDGVDAFIDLYGPEYLDLALELGVAPARIDTIISFERAAQIGARTDGSVAGTSREVLTEIATRAADGRLDVEVAATYSLEQVADAFAELERGHTRGKIVLLPAGPLPADDPDRALTVTSSDDPGNDVLGMVGDTYTVLIAGEQTAGAYTLIDMSVPPGGGPGPHRHDFEELFIVQEGTITLTFRGTTHTVSAGQVANVPANAPHFFRNTGDVPTRMLCLCTPAAQEDFFRAVADPLADRSTPVPHLEGDALRAWLTLAGRLAPSYRTELLPPPA